MTNPRHNLWFSQKQKDIQTKSKKRRTFGTLKSGIVVEYTEMVVVGEEPLGKFDDYKLLGEGEAHQKEDNYKKQNM